MYKSDILLSPKCIMLSNLPLMSALRFKAYFSLDKGT